MVLAGEAVEVEAAVAAGVGAAVLTANLKGETPASGQESEVSETAPTTEAQSSGSSAGKEPPKEGRYEFPDKTADDATYVGQSGNIPKRLEKHVRDGRLEPGTEATAEVTGGKTAREVSEHKRIQEITGGVPAKESEKVANKIDPIGPKRKHLLEED